MTGSIKLRDYPSDYVRLVCERCGRKGQYRKAKLIEKYGTNIRLPDLKMRIVKCDRRGQMHDACRARFLGLLR